MPALVLLPVLVFFAASSAPGQSVVESASVGTVVPGVGVVGTLSGGGIGDDGDAVLDDGSFFETWALHLETPSFITIDVLSEDFDPYIFLALADDTIMAENDDCVPNAFQHSCLHDVPAPIGTYYVGVNTFSPGETGDYAMIVQVVPLPEPGSTGLLALAGLLALRRRR